MSVAIGERLGAAPAVRAARKALGEAGDVWIVGGAIRDAALEREVTDVDLAVLGDAGEAARAVARAAGGPAFQLSEEFAAWRTLGGDGGWRLDVARVRGDGIEEDLGHRDFTVNAVAVPLADPAAEPVDPHRGLGDLEERLLRAVSDRSFIEDPLRVVRAARIAASTALEVDPGTEGLARAAADRVSEISGERQLAELRLMLTGEAPVRSLELLDRLGATAAVLPEVEALRGVVQNPNHHLDVHGHTLEVLRRLLEVESDLDRYAGDRTAEAREVLAEPLADELTRGGALRFGALLHDVGKPATRSEQSGFVTFIGHDSEGARMIETIGRRLRASGKLTAYLRDLALHHLRLGFLIHERPLSRRRVYEYLRATEPVSVEVTLLSVADRLSARGEGAIAGEEMVQAHLDLAKELLAAALDWRREGPPRPPVRGDELASELGIEPGPELGRLLGEIQAAVYAGEVSSREEAIDLARQSLRNPAEADA